MKRTPLRRGSKPLTRKRPLKAKNAQRQAKRKAAYAKYLASPQWKAKRAAALQRAGHRCEAIMEMDARRSVFGGGWGTMPQHSYPMRCEATTRLECHHSKYPRTLGSEPLDSLVVLCRAHHETLHASQDWWKR